MKIANKMLLCLTAFAVLVVVDRVAHAEPVQTGWGDWDTDKWNRNVINGEQKGYEPPSGVYPPGPESYKPAPGELIGTTRWIWRNAANSPDPVDPNALYVRGANRVVYWSKRQNSPRYQQIDGSFDEPDISGLNTDDPLNKPTFYFGATGFVNGDATHTDTGIQWETAGTGEAGWTLVHRVKVAINDKDTRAQLGTWELWLQDGPDARIPKGELGTIYMEYYVGKKNRAVISFKRATDTESREWPATIYDPRWDVNVVDLRRVVGLTQRTSPRKAGEGSTKEEKAKAEQDLQNMKLLPEGGDNKLVSLVFLDGSVIKGLKFANGHLRTYKAADADGVPQQSDLWVAAAAQKPTREGHVLREVEDELKLPAEERDPNFAKGMSDRLRPPSKIPTKLGAAPDSRYIIDFVHPPTYSRDPNNTFNYQTGFSTENVRIIMGDKPKPVEVKALPDEKKPDAPKPDTPPQ